MSNEPKIITVRELKALCEAQINNGNGNKQILISDDDEGNGFHSLFYSFTESIEDIEAYADLFHDGNDPKDVILLG